MEARPTLIEVFWCQPGQAPTTLTCFFVPERYAKEQQTATPAQFAEFVLSQVQTITAIKGSNIKVFTAPSVALAEGGSQGGAPLGKPIAPSFVRLDAQSRIYLEEEKEPLPVLYVQFFQ